MKQYFLRGLAASTLLALGLTGCVSAPKQQAFNHEAHANIKTIGVLETQPTHTSVFMLNNPGASFGLIGGLVAASDQASKEKKLQTILDQAGFVPLSYFKERLSVHMTERGYTLIWPQSQTETAKVQRGAYGLRSGYSATSNADAQFDINFGFVGYAAAGASAGAPYRPTVTVGARLVSPDGQQNFYTDYFAYNNVFNVANAVVLNASADYSYPGFDDLEKAGPAAVEGLKTAIDSVAAEVARQL